MSGFIQRPHPGESVGSQRASQWPPVLELSRQPGGPGFVPDIVGESGPHCR